MKDTKRYSLRALRKKKGLTLQELAEQTGISPTTLYIFETSAERRRNFNVGMKHTLASFFHVPVRMLFPEITEQIDVLAGKKVQIQMFIPREDLKKD